MKGGRAERKMRGCWSRAVFLCLIFAPTSNGLLSATRHRLSAPNLQIDLWYADGRWVALEAPTPGGRTLRYEL